MESFTNPDSVAEQLVDRTAEGSGPTDRVLRPTNNHPGRFQRIMNVFRKPDTDPALEPLRGIDASRVRTTYANARPVQSEARSQVSREVRQRDLNLDHRERVADSTLFNTRPENRAQRLEQIIDNNRFLAHNLDNALFQTIYLNTIERIPSSRRSEAISEPTVLNHIIFEFQRQLNNNHHFERQQNPLDLQTQIRIRSGYFANDPRFRDIVNEVLRNETRQLRVVTPNQAAVLAMLKTQTGISEEDIADKLKMTPEQLTEAMVDEDFWNLLDEIAPSGASPQVEDFQRALGMRRVLEAQKRYMAELDERWREQTSDTPLINREMPDFLVNIREGTEEQRTEAMRLLGEISSFDLSPNSRLMEHITDLGNGLLSSYFDHGLAETPIDFWQRIGRINLESQTFRERHVGAEYPRRTQPYEVLEMVYRLAAVLPGYRVVLEQQVLNPSEEIQSQLSQVILEMTDFFEANNSNRNGRLIEMLAQSELALRLLSGNRWHGLPLHFSRDSSVPAFARNGITLDAATAEQRLREGGIIANPPTQPEEEREPIPPFEGVDIPREVRRDIRFMNIVSEIQHEANIRGISLDPQDVYMQALELYNYNHQPSNITTPPPVPSETSDSTPLSAEELEQLRTLSRRIQTDPGTFNQTARQNPPIITPEQRDLLLEHESRLERNSGSEYQRAETLIGNSELPFINSGVLAEQLGVDNERAEEILDQLEKDGLIGPEIKSGSLMRGQRRII